ncbi:hypothetical protein TI39_contig505g00007 [Zymoseptoria brevis]|uniref:Uncharacterized protein n=1 Tax=Zymoseptoria brevis TaxID=1047168 RepID=A0A0F4GJS7_9PEZI|nr:hypothetical protein TI39_contig505g00007 [Zymoseptoria brevis]
MAVHPGPSRLFRRRKKALEHMRKLHRDLENLKKEKERESAASDRKFRTLEDGLEVAQEFAKAYESDVEKWKSRYETVKAINWKLEESIGAVEADKTLLVRRTAEILGGYDGGSDCSGSSLKEKSDTQPAGYLRNVRDSLDETVVQQYHAEVRARRGSEESSTRASFDDIPRPCTPVVISDSATDSSSGSPTHRLSSSAALSRHPAEQRFPSSRVRQWWMDLKVQEAFGGSTDVLDSTDTDGTVPEVGSRGSPNFGTAPGDSGPSQSIENDCETTQPFRDSASIRTVHRRESVTNESSSRPRNPTPVQAAAGGEASEAVESSAGIVCRRHSAGDSEHGADAGVMARHNKRESYIFRTGLKVLPKFTTSASDLLQKLGDTFAFDRIERKRYRTQRMEELIAREGAAEQYECAVGE